MSKVAEHPPEEHLSMGIDPYEKAWMRVSVVLLVAFAIVVSVAGFAMGFQIPGADDEVDPRTVAETSPWNDPGVREIGDGEFEAYVVAQAWSFSPRELVVPAGAKLTVHVTTIDVQHGFKVTDTNLNMMVVPGQVSTLEHTFDEVGEFPYLCTEYCGRGHASMFGVVKVVSQADYDAAQKSETTDTTDTTVSTGG
jgi:cytochrome c oxidase subunit 2